MHHGPYRIRHRATAAAAALTLVMGALTGCSKEVPENTVADFLAGWRSGDLSRVGFISADGGKISANDVLDQLQTLTGDLAKQSLVLSTVGGPTVTGDIASNAIKLDWTLPGGVPWSYQSTVRLTKRNSDGWKVVWEPAIVQNELNTGDTLRIRRVPSTRASILDAAGRPIVTKRPVVIIGVEPQGVTNLAQLQAGLATAFRRIGVTVDMSGLKDRIDEAKKDAFVELITLRDTDYEKIHGQIEQLQGQGAVTRRERRDLAPTRAFARALLGTADEATRDDIEANPEVIARGDIVGHGGLQQQYDTTLRGTAATSVVIAQVAADGTVSDTQIFSTKPVDGKPVKTTLDVATQLAADQALAAEKQPSSLVAIRISDGALLAVANGPDGGTVNTALSGQVPPGSTFKTVSAYGLLQQRKVTANTVVPCPKTAVVNGRQFRNSDGEVLGRVPFRTDYAKSCNTAFVGLAPALGAAGLQKAAADLGLGGDWDIGVGAFSGRVSAGDNPTELAAAAFGQGTTVVSPLAMANVAASVARGQFTQPKLVLDPPPVKPVADGAKLDPAAVNALRAMMREVVTQGTGTALRSIPGQPVFGKTGTAEFADQTAQTHSWFIGYQGDIAFAAMVQKGGLGSQAAVPAVGRFLTALNRR